MKSRWLRASPTRRASCSRDSQVSHSLRLLHDSGIGLLLPVPHETPSVFDEFSEVKITVGDIHTLVFPGSKEDLPELVTDEGTSPERRYPFHTNPVDSRYYHAVGNGVAHLYGLPRRSPLPFGLLDSLHPSDRGRIHKDVSPH